MLSSKMASNDEVDARAMTPGAAIPGIDVRVVLFTVHDGGLLVALYETNGIVCLPRTIPARDESLDVAAARVLGAMPGLEERYLEQLYTISHSTGDEWTITVAYLGVALISSAAGGEIHWCEATGLPDMAVLDRRIVEYALLRLRAKLGYTTIAFHLLPPTFSLSELQQVYEVVLNRQLDKRNFRRRIQAAGFLEATGKTRREGSHRPARLFRFRAAHDAETYLTPAWENNARSTQERL